jgi:hypothetical protein
VSAPTTIAPACPAWCTLPPGHDAHPDDIDGSRYIRHRVVDGLVEVEQCVVVEPDGAVDTELVVWLDGHRFTYARAQELSVELARALTTAGGR